MSLNTVYLVAFLDAFNFALALPVVNVHVMALGGSFMLCGILQSTGAGMQLFASPIIGGLSDMYGRKLVLISTLAVMFIGDAVAGIDSLQLFFIGRILYGLARHTDPIIKATITDLLPDKQAQSNAFKNLLILPGFAFITAPALGGLLHQYYNSFAIISSVLCTIDLILIATVLIYIPGTKSDKKTDTEKKYNWKKYLNILSIKLAVEVAYNFLFMNTGLIFTKNYLFTRTQLGLSIAYMSITMTAGAIITPLINKRFYTNDTTGSKRIVHSLVLMVASFLVLVTVNNAPLHLGIFVPASLAKMMLEIAWMEALTAQMNESEKGFMMGIATSMLSAAGLVCPLISGIVADYISIGLLTSLPLAPSIVGALLANKMQRIHVN